MEDRTFTDLAFRPDVAPHEVDDVFGDRRAQSGSAESTGYAVVALVERREDHRQLLGGHTDSRVGDGEVENVGFATGLNGSLYASEAAGRSGRSHLDGSG